MNASTNDDARAPILLVDDIPENLYAMAELLSLPSYDLVQVGSGAAALEQVRQREFAVVLLDVQMPGMDGFETAREMKRLAAEQRREVPVIFVTAIETDRPHISRAYLEGAVDFLQKPIDPDEIRSKVSVFVEFFRAKERLRQGLQAAVRSREDQMTILSHDLRNPLTTVLLSAKQLERQADATSSGARVQRAARAIIRAVDRMTRLVSDLLDLAKIEAGGTLPVDVAPHDVAELVAQAAELQEALATSQRISLSADVNGPTYAMCDADRVQQVLANLIGNAIKFTPPGGTIDVRARTSDGEVVVSVKDTGAGIPSDQVPHLFEPYWQADAERKRGAGLGLSIAKAIVVAHGGRIWVESAPGAGSAFNFTLPSSSGPMAS
jgi:signal transduction histidine kinase